MSGNLENRVSSLENQVADILGKLGSNGEEKDWRRSLGMFNDHPEMKEIDKQGKRIRKNDRSKGADDHS